MRQPRKPKTAEPTLLQRLNKPLRDIVADLETNVAEELKKVRERDSAEYLQIAVKLLPLIAALNPTKSEFADCNDKQALGIALLKSVRGADELEIELTEDMISAALKANDEFIDQLQAIRAAAEGAIQ